MKTSVVSLLMLLSTTAQAQYENGYHHDYNDSPGRDYYIGVLNGPTNIYVAPNPVDYAQAERIRYDMAVEQYEFRQQRSLAVQAERQARRDRYRSNYITRRDTGTLYRPTYYPRATARNNPKGSGWSTSWATALLVE